MVRVKVQMRGTGEPLKRTPVTLYFDATQKTLDAMTDRDGIVEFDIAPASGKLIIAGITRFQGRLDGELLIELWSVTETSTVTERGAPGGFNPGSTAYPGMDIRTLKVNGTEVLTDSEGYLVNLDDWSEDFVRAEANREGLQLSSEHWEVIRFLRDFYEKRNVQCTVRDMIKHFRKVWGAEKGTNHYLHLIFPRGGPQKQGNRLAGLMRTKGEH